jgi:hypothetical protein
METLHSWPSRGSWAIVAAKYPAASGIDSFDICQTPCCTSFTVSTINSPNGCETNVECPSWRPHGASVNTARSSRSTREASSVMSAPASRRCSIHRRINTLGLTLSSLARCRTHTINDFGSCTEVMTVGSGSESLSHTLCSVSVVKPPVGAMQRKFVQSIHQISPPQIARVSAVLAGRTSVSIVSGEPGQETSRALRSDRVPSTYGRGRCHDVHDPVMTHAHDFPPALRSTAVSDSRSTVLAARPAPSRRWRSCVVKARARTMSP